MSGWIKMHRQALETPELQSFDARGVWEYLLLRAAYKPTRVVFRNRPVCLDVGQLAISIHGTAQEGLIGHKKLRRILDLFEESGMIKMDKAKGKPFSLITICNYTKYQLVEDDQGKAKGKARAKLGQTEQEVEEGKESYTPHPSGGTPYEGVRPADDGLAKEGVRGTRIPDDWTPGRDGVEYALAELGPWASVVDKTPGELVDDTFNSFLDFWRAKAGAAARKASWPLTWKTWVRRTKDELREKERRAAERRERFGGRAA